jgi:hypothetical protein
VVEDGGQGKGKQGHTGEESKSNLACTRGGGGQLTIKGLPKSLLPFPSPLKTKKVRSTIKSAGDIDSNPRTLTHGTI